MLDNLGDGQTPLSSEEADRRLREALATARPGKPEDVIGLRSLVSYMYNRVSDEVTLDAVERIII